MRISIFLSYPKPCFGKQNAFIKQLTEYLKSRGFEPRTLGVTDYDLDAPLTAVRRLMIESNGLITVAFRRTYIKHGSLPVLIFREKDVVRDIGKGSGRTLHA
jgi:hypothetical protein